MTSNGRSRLADLKVIGLVVSITLGLGGMAWTVVSWASSVKTNEVARQDHEVLHRRITKVNDKAEGAVQEQEKMQQTIGRDVKTIKCLLTAPNRKAKANCGLE